MPRLKVNTGPEFAQFPSSNLRIMHNGEVELATVNLAPDPDFTKFHPHSKLKHWKFRHHKNPHGWHAHIKQTSDTRITRQNRAHHKHHHTHQHPSALVIGPTPPDVSVEAPLPQPGAPTVDTPAITATGYAAGTYGVAPLWVMADPVSGEGDDAINSTLLTRAGPVTNVTTTSGLPYISVALPAVLPKGVTGVAVAMTPVNNPTGPLYIQATELVKTGVATTQTYAGPWRGTDPAPTANQTYLGGSRALAAPEYHYGPAEFDLQAMTVRLSYRLLTSGGWTASQGVTGWITTPATPRAALWWRPTSFPAGTIDWEGEYQLDSEAGAWHTLRPRPYAVVTPEDELEHNPTAEVSNNLVNHYACLYQSDLESYPTVQHLPAQNDPLPYDYSGVPSPDVGFSSVTAVAATGVTAGSSGVHEVRVSHVTDNIEGPASPPTTLYVPANSTVRVHPPRLSNLIPNGDLLEADRADGLELDWEKPAPGNVVASFTPGVITLTDTRLDSPWQANHYYSVGNFVTPTTPNGHLYKVTQSGTSGSGTGPAFNTGAGSTTNSSPQFTEVGADSWSDTDVRRTPKTPVDPTRKYVVRVSVSTSTLTTGAIRAVLRQWNAGGVSDTTIGTLSTANTSTTFEATVGPAGSRSQVIWGANTFQYQIMLVSLASVNGGVRNLTFSASNVYGGYGHATPRVRALPRPVDPYAQPGTHAHGPIAEGEPASKPYPIGNYAVVVASPTDGALRSADVVMSHEGFESGGFSAGSIWAQTQAGSATSAFTTTGPVTGSQSWRIAATNTGVSNSASATATLATAQPSAGISSQRVINSLPSTGTVRIGSLVDTNAKTLAYVLLSSAGNLTLNTVSDANAVQTSASIAVTTGTVIDLRLMAQYAGTTGGTASLSVGTAGGSTTQTVTLSNVAWTQAQFGSVIAGAFVPSATGQAWDMLIDSLMVLGAGESSSTPIPGNAAEYFAVPGTPIHQDVFLTGMKVPVLPGVTYCSSLFMEFKGVELASSPLVSAFCDIKGRVIQRNAPLVSGMAGTQPWQRYYQTLTAPPKAAYLKYITSPMAGGRVRAMGFQVEKGLYPSAYTNAYALSGTITVTFNLSSPMPPGSGPNPVGSMSKVSLYRRADALITNSPSGGTGYSVLFRTAPDGSGLSWTPWTTFANVIPNTFLQMQVTLTSATGTNTPVMRSIHLDYVRPVPILTRLHGDEFMGGCLVGDMAPVQELYNIQPRVFADETRGFRVFGAHPHKEISKMELQCFLESTTVEIARAQGKGTASFAIEDPQLLKRYIVRFFNADFGSGKTDRSVYVPVPGLDENVVWLHSSAVKDIQVLGEAAL